MQLHLQVAPGRRSAGTGTRPSAWPGCSSRSARTRRSCSARGCGRRPGSRCSSSPATCARPSCATRASGRGCGSASGGSLGAGPVHRERPLLPGAACRCTSDDRPDGRARTPAGCPELDELTLHNGTIWRWNRPIYDIADGDAARAAGEPGAAGRADDRRHGGERAVLLRAAARARRGRPAAVGHDVVRGGRGELHHRRPARHGRRRCTGRAPGWIRPDELVLRKLLPDGRTRGWPGGASAPPSGTAT